MTNVLFGRTGRVVPSVWLGLIPAGSEEGNQSLVEAALAAKTVIDVTRAPGLWGHYLRGIETPLSLALGRELQHIGTPEAARTYLEGEFLQTFSQLGRPQIDFVALTCLGPLPENVLDAALQVLEETRQEGLIGHYGLWSAGHPMSTLALWQFCDAFEFVVVANNPTKAEPFDMISSMAESRRVGILSCETLAWVGAELSDERAVELIRQAGRQGPVVVGVKTPGEVRNALLA